jgi:hypothetical protein
MPYFKGFFNPRKPHWHAAHFAALVCKKSNTLKTLYGITLLTRVPPCMLRARCSDVHGAAELNALAAIPSCCGVTNGLLANY